LGVLSVAGGACIDAVTSTTSPSSICGAGCVTNSTSGAIVVVVTSVVGTTVVVAISPSSDPDPDPEPDPLTSV